MIIDGRKIREEILSAVQKEIALLSFQPVFCDVLVGDNSVSEQYVKMKGKMAERVGIKFLPANFPKTISESELTAEIKKLGEVPNICGVIVQMPLPENFDKKPILDSVLPSLDVDCLGEVASKKFYENNNKIGFPTALACMAIIGSLHQDLTCKKIVVLGAGDLVGKPVAHLLKSRGFQVTILTRHTENNEDYIKEADVIISGIGHGKYLTGEMVKPGVVIIDAGTSESNGSIVGDVDLDSVKDVASAVSPVPGGVGPVTVAMLLKNVLEVAKTKVYGKY